MSIRFSTTDRWERTFQPKNFAIVLKTMGLDRQLSVFPSKANCDSHLTNKWHRQGWHAKLAMLKLVNEVTFVFFQ